MRQLWYFLTDVLWLVLYALATMLGLTKKYEADKYKKEWSK